jgi:hypothetical protein
LLNAHYPLFAFASGVSFGKIDFSDEPQLNNEFSPFYRILGAQELNKPILINPNKVTIQNENELSNVELNQIVYRKPERIGDVVFNYWD